jgi:hypothetical protein
MHRPDVVGRDGLEVKLVADGPGPVRSDIGLETNLAAYQKLLSGLA